MYSITDVSRLLQVHSQTVRNWERKGLLKPQRLGLVRIFSDGDLKLCEEIKRYSRRGVNLGRVRRILRFKLQQPAQPENGGGQ
jgi:MerR family transcriptional regulator, heat shock protein HspR